MASFTLEAGHKPNAWKFRGTVFFIGVGVMAVEITASRLLAPYFGASLFVWTSLIVTVLLALSFGYWYGGNMAKKNLTLESVGYLLCGVAGLLLIGLFFIPYFALTISHALVTWSQASTVLFLGSFLVSVVIFAAPIFLLAMSGPIILKQWSTLGDIGVISGQYFAISTLGSVIGTLAPTLVLVPYFGARRTIEIIAIIFLVIGFFLMPRKKGFMAIIFLSPIVMTLSFRAPAIAANIIFERESPYQLIRIFEVGTRRTFTFNEGMGVQSVYDPSKTRTNMYFDYPSIAPLLRPFHADGHHRAVIIGLAGGSVARRYATFLPSWKGIDLTGVELDSAVIETAQKYFALDEIPFRVVNQDGRVFLASHQDLFDVIIVDAYSTQLYIPSHLVTKEFFALVKSRLQPGGAMVMNINAPNKDSRLLRALANTVASQFEDVRLVPIANSWNYLLLASDQKFDLSSVEKRIPLEYNDVREAVHSAFSVFYNEQEEAFDDDRAPVEFLTDAMILHEVLKKK